MSIISSLINKQIDSENAVKTAIEDSVILSELLEGLQSSNEPVRYNSFKVILLVSEKRPEILYPRWSLFETMLTNDNSFFRAIAIQIIANLTKVDTANRFEAIFERYFDELGGDKTMTVGYVASNAGKIALAKPQLRLLITEKLLDIGKIHKGKQIDLIKGYVIEAFGVYFKISSDKEQASILEFVKKEQTSHSPRTRKASLDFLKKFGEE